MRGVKGLVLVLVVVFVGFGAVCALAGSGEGAAKEKDGAKTKVRPKTYVYPAATLPNTPKIKAGTISIVKCDDGVHSYAVCLPSDYEERERCPVIFCFDPGGDGKLAVRKFAFSAEKYGCIIAGSLDARNGPWETILKAQSAMLEDMAKRYKTDEKKYYSAGFSGGARMSYTIAYNNPSKFKGVIACGGGFGLGKISKDAAVYHCAGDADSAGMFEVKKSHLELQRNGVESELNVFSGGHGWPPRIVIKHALDWLMKETNVNWGSQGSSKLKANFVSVASGRKKLCETRILHFPNKRSFGALYVLDENIERRIKSFHHWIDGAEWEYLCEATGEVKAPAGKRLLLVVNKAGCKDLSPLSKLGPDDLYDLGFRSGVPEFNSAGNRNKSYIVGLTGLKELGLRLTNASGEGMRFIKEMKSLECLTLPGRIDDAGLAEVAEQRSLKRLHFSGKNLVTNEGLAVLAKLSSLEELSLTGSRIGDDGLVHLAKLPSLRYLMLYGENFSDAGMAHLKNVPSLKILNLAHLKQITDEGVEYLSGLENIENVTFYWNENITNKGAVYLSRMKSLKKLDIAHSRINDDGLAHLSKVKTLEYLHLPNQGITDKGLMYVCKLDKLKHLDVGGSSKSPLTDEGLEHLSKLSCLEELDISSTEITDEGMSHIAKLTNLRELHLHTDTITNEGLAKLTTLKLLEHLTLPIKAKITVSGVSGLNALSNLTYLYAYGVVQDNSGLDISGLTKLENLTISTPLGSGTIIRDEDMACLANLKKLKWLQGVAGVSDAGMAHLAGLTNMERLSVSGSDLTDKGLSYLAGMKKLNHLTVSDGNFTEKGLRHLEDLKALGFLRITSQNDIKRGAVLRLRRKLPNILTFEVKKNEPDRRRGGRPR